MCDFLQQATVSRGSGVRRNPDDLDCSHGRERDRPPLERPRRTDVRPMRIRLFAFDLDGEALAKIAPRIEIRAWLREWTGVSVYRDGFRVWAIWEPQTTGFD